MLMLMMIKTSLFLVMVMILMLMMMMLNNIRAASRPINMQTATLFHIDAVFCTAAGDDDVVYQF